MKKMDIPVVAVGPGSQPGDDDGVVMESPSAPGEMSTYRMPDLSVREDLGTLSGGLTVLSEIESMLEDYRIGDQPRRRALDDLDRDNRELVDEVLGDGEVSIVYADEVRIQIQESVLAGVWRIQHLGRSGQIVNDLIEVADIPSVVREASFLNPSVPCVSMEESPPGVMNAPPVITEITNKATAFHRGDEPYVINLSLLPQTEEDLAYLHARLGIGPVSILSRGYGNCRITSTATPFVWWVQYFNSDDINILNTLEISEVPAVACAAQEDLADSAERLRLIMEVYA